MTGLSRRDFLKLASVAVGGAAASRAASMLSRSSTGRPNVLILLFDTLSAPHLSLYGYPRSTTPNLTRFAEKATVYHTHYSSSSFTTSGTASILTGLLPWHHRAVDSGGVIRRQLVENNLFRMVGPDYFRIGFTQNLWADLFLRQFHSDLDLHMSPASFAYNNPLLLSGAAPNDPVPYYAFDDFLVGGFKQDTRYPGSVMLGMLDVALGRGHNLGPEMNGAAGVEGAPFNFYFYYQNRAVFQGIYETLKRVLSARQQPYLGYFHLWSPHEPYSPEEAFRELFPDDLRVPHKPKHPLIEVAVHEQELRRYRLAYDQYIANVDAEFGRLMDQLGTSGLLENTYVIVLSDHGQLFERGVHGHGSRLMYDEGIHTPLIISAPGQNQRVDVHEPTSNVDLVPTLAAILGVQPLANHDGHILPGLGGGTDAERSIFSIQAKESSAFQPLTTGSFVLNKGKLKLILYAGYRGYDEIVELYDLERDPYEMKDLSRAAPKVAGQMREEILDTRQAADRLITGSAH